MQFYNLMNRSDAKGLYLLVFCVVFFLNSKHMNAFIEDILSRIQDLLELAPPVSLAAYIHIVCTRLRNIEYTHQGCPKISFYVILSMFLRHRWVKISQH